jgi:ubiquinone/menaquinone biosynthesis C-methylase UbiE
MNCICCLSDRITPGPIGLNGYFRCLDCGFLFEVPYENIREKVIRHYEQADPHRKVAISKQVFFLAALKHIATHFKKCRGALLDVGCGFGYFLDLAAKEGWQTWGVEVMSYMHRKDKQKTIKHNIYRGTLKEAEYPDNFFDVATLWDVLFIVERPFDELAECYRLLKKGGMIGIRVRNVLFQELIYRIYYPFRKIAWTLGIKAPYVFHPYCYSTESMRNLLDRVGFTSIKITHSPLTSGDPYRYTDIAVLTRTVKVIIDIFSKVFFWMSGGKRIIGPSLLIWAEKPQIGSKG